MAINNGQIQCLTYDPSGSLVHVVKPPAQSTAFASTYAFDAYGLPINYWPSNWTVDSLINTTVMYSAGDDISFLYKGQAGYDTFGGWGEIRSSDGTIVCGGALINCWHRWYDPFSGRWISRDPTGLDGGENAYEFCDGNPLMLADPDGTEAQAVFLGLRLVIGGGADAAPAAGAGCVGAGGLYGLSATGGWIFGTIINNHFGLSQSLADEIGGWNRSQQQAAEDPDWEALTRLWKNSDLLGQYRLEASFPMLARWAASRRANLTRMEKHHLLPQEHRAWFFDHGIKNIDLFEFIAVLDRLKHQMVHGKGGGDAYFNSWNKLWQRFMDENPNASRKDILSHLTKMRRQFGI